ncbi:MAG: Mur ligase family protein [Synergistaceae bacterium]|nr:Mur ligase family protein [Synergistaceae bacterium]
MNSLSVEDRIEKLASPGIKPGLSRVACLLNELGNPQHTTRVIHVVGTNGKGSTAATIHNILLKSGYSTALYTSPHLVDFEERLLLFGKKTLSAYWHEALDKIEGAIARNIKLKKSPPTFFELTTVAAILIMSSQNVEVAVVEAGMGGRFDATSILTNVVCSVICQIDLDHQQFLGNTLEKIANEKFAVIRQGSLAIFYGQESLNKLFINIANLHKTSSNIFTSEASITNVICSLSSTQFSLTFKGLKKNYTTPLLGTFASENVAFAIYITYRLIQYFPRINQQFIYSGVSTVIWPGRFEIISSYPLIILDGGHNPHAIQKLCTTLLKLCNTKITLVVAMMKDKDVKTSLLYLKLLDANFIATEVPNNSRSMKASEIACIAREVGLTVIANCSIPLDAIEMAKKLSNPIIILGSLFLVGYVKKMYQADY